MVSERRAAGVVAVLAAGALVLVGGPVGAAAERVDTVRLTPVDADGGGVALLARVPDALAGQPLDASAFAVRQGDRPLAVTAQRAVDAPSQLVLGLDTSQGAEALRAEQAAAADLLRALPPDLPTVLLPGGTGGTARTGFVRVGALQPDAGSLLDGLGEAPEGRRTVVLLTSCEELAAAAATEPAEQLAAAAQVHVLALDTGCEAVAEGLARPGAGIARTGLSGGSLIAGIDAVGRELTATYLLRVAADPAGAPLQVRVTGSGGSGEGVLALPGSGSGSGPTAAGPVGADELPTVPVALAAGLLAVVAVGVVVVRVRTGRRRPAGVR